MKDITLTFDRIHVRKGTLEIKTLERNKNDDDPPDRKGPLTGVTVEGIKTIYLSQSRYKIPAKEIVAYQVDVNNASMARIEAVNKDGRFTFVLEGANVVVPNHHHHHHSNTGGSNRVVPLDLQRRADQERWQIFCRRIMRLHAKFHGTDEAAVETFTRNKGRFGGTAAAASSRSRSSRPGVARRAFGTVPSSLPSRRRGGGPGTIAYRPTTTLIKTAASRTLLPERFSDDEEEEGDDVIENAGGSIFNRKKSKTQEDEMEPRLSEENEPNLTEQDDETQSEKQHDDENQHTSLLLPELESSSEEDQEAVRPVTARGKRKTGRLRKQGVAVRRQIADSDNEDDDLFENANDHNDFTSVDNYNNNNATTTPKARRVVESPPETTICDKTLLTSKTPLHSTGSGQTTMSRFFQAHSSTAPKSSSSISFDPAKRSTSAASTPKLRLTQSSPRRLAAARLVQSAQTTLKHDATDWLRTSPNKSNSAEKRRRALGLQSLDLPDDPITNFSNDDDAPAFTATFQRAATSCPLKRRRIHSTPAPSVSLTTMTLDRRRSYEEAGSSSAWPHSAIKTNLSRFLAPSSPTNLPTAAPAQPLPRCRGLRNLGNTCYINASLQMLCTAIHFWKAIEGRGGELAKSLVSVAKELHDQTVNTPVNPKAVKEAMDQRTDKFIGFEQRDAHEFLSDLVDGIHEELEDDKKQNMGTSQDALADKEKNVLAKKATMPDLPTDEFRLTVQVCLKCESCGYERSKEEIYRHLSIDIVEAEPTDSGVPSPTIARGSVEQSLKQFFQPEIREIKCEKCESGTHAMQMTRVLSQPQFLLLHLKRFIFVEKPRPSAGDENAPNAVDNGGPPEYVFQKNKTPVTIPESVSLDPFRIENSAESQSSSQTYALKSIVHHLGSRASSGHYTADAVRYVAQDKDAEQKEVASATTEVSSEPASEVYDPYKWVTFDDTNSCITSLQKITLNKNKRSTAYMLLYCLNPGPGE